MAAQFSIPRFLLPQSGLLWRRANLGKQVRNSELLTVRYASTTAKTAKGKQVVLEKPARFNPPSHGARLPRKNRPQQQHYGGALSSDEVAAQKRTDYPGLMAPKGTWGHWFWNNRAVHICITTVSLLLVDICTRPVFTWLIPCICTHTQGTLASLAIFTAVENFKANTPFAEMLPTASDYWQHPILSGRTTYEVWRLTTLHNSAVTAEKRKKKVDDVVKRSEYRQAHGLNQEGTFGNWTVKADPQGPPPDAGQKREKWLGIF